MQKGLKNELFRKIYTKKKRKRYWISKDYDSGYKEFKIGVMLKLAREEAGLTQEELQKNKG